MLGFQLQVVVVLEGLEVAGTMEIFRAHDARLGHGCCGQAHCDQDTDGDVHVTGHSFSNQLVALAKSR